MNRLTLSSPVALAVGISLALAAIPAHAENTPAKRVVIHAQSELPTYSYKLTTPTASALLDDDAALLALADAVRKDAEATLAKYDITDMATLRDLYGAIRDAALIRGDAKAALANSAKIRELADKPAEKLTSGLFADAAAAAILAGEDPALRKAAFKNAFAASINPLPWNVVGEKLIAWKGQLAMPFTEGLMRGGMQSALDPIVKQSGEIPGDAARELISAVVDLRRIAAYSSEVKMVLGEYIAAHKQPKPDIWITRKVVLDASKQKLTPVVTAIWDEGVDTSLFPGQLYTNAAEKLDGKDNDGDGFVDDIHGIGFDENNNPVTESLIPFDSKYPGREAELRELHAGSSDLNNGIDSTAAKVFRDRWTSLKPEDVADFMGANTFYGNYAHGTHVAGIATDSNPAARVMVIRFNFDNYKIKPLATTPEVAHRIAENFKAIVGYMKAHDVRVVNMSWIESLDDIEISLTKNGIGKSGAERHKIALEAFRIEADALTATFRDAPKILFVAAAGNSNNDVGFARFIPADIDLPNVLTVGAVDQAGDEASFTSYGKRVRVYANFQVSSVEPGGAITPFSGTSAAAPQVTNLAAKLFALNPKLTPVEVIKLILDGATKSADGKRSLINPKASVALLQATH